MEVASSMMKADGQSPGEDSACSGSCDKCGRPCENPSADSEDDDGAWGAMVRSLSTAFGAGGSDQVGRVNRESAATCSTCSGTGCATPLTCDSDTDVGSDVAMSATVSCRNYEGHAWRQTRPRPSVLHLDEDDADEATDFVSNFFDYLDANNPLSPTKARSRPPLGGPPATESQLDASEASTDVATLSSGGLQQRLDKRKERREARTRRVPCLPSVDELDDGQETSASSQQPPPARQAFQNAVFAAKFAQRVKQRRGAIKVRAQSHPVATTCVEETKESCSESHADETRSVASSEAEGTSESSGSSWLYRLAGGSTLFTTQAPQAEPAADEGNALEAKIDGLQQSRLQRRMQKRLDRRGVTSSATSEEQEPQERSAQADRESSSSSRGFLSSIFGYGAADTRSVISLDEDDDGDGEYHNIWGDSDTEQLASKRLREFRRKKLAGG